MIVGTEEDYKNRELHFEEQEKLLGENLENERKNYDFTQVYEAGWKQIDHLIMNNPGAARLYAFLARHIDASCGAVLASHELLAKELGCTTRSIRNYASYLEQKGALVKIKVSGSVYAYALNPKEVWKSWDTKKSYATFNTKTLASIKTDGDIKRRLMLMMQNSNDSLAQENS